MNLINLKREFLSARTNPGTLNFQASNLYEICFVLRMITTLLYLCYCNTFYKCFPDSCTNIYKTTIEYLKGKKKKNLVYTKIPQTCATTDIICVQSWVPVLLHKTGQNYLLLSHTA